MQTNMVTIIGTPISPFVRKALAFCALKNIPFAIEPISAFFGNDEFARLSPLRRIPVLIDGPVSLCDSSVICQYLEDKYPTPALYPADIGTRAQARWLEEFSDTRLSDILIWKLFSSISIKPRLWGVPCDDDLVAKTLAEDVPEVMNYLESLAPVDGFLCGAFSIADIAVATPFANFLWARQTIDASRWPKTAAWLLRVQSEPCISKFQDIGRQLLKTPVPEHRDFLKAQGLMLTEKRYGDQELRAPGTTSSIRLPQPAA